MQKMVKNEYLQVLNEIKKIFEKNKISIWLEDGTLLGAYRDKKIIAGDEFDIDLGILKSSLNKKAKRKKLASDLSERGFSTFFFWDVVNIVKGKIGIDVILILDSEKEIFKLRERSDGDKSKEFLRWMNKLKTVEYYGPISLDKKGIFKIFNFLPNFLRRGLYNLFLSIVPKNKRPFHYKLKIDKKHFSNLRNIKYYGLSFYIPNYVEEYLTLNYGEWRKPLKKDKKWDWREYGEWRKIDEK